MWVWVRMPRAKGDRGAVPGKLQGWWEWMMRYEGSSVARCRARCERSPLCPEDSLRIAAMSSSRVERMRISSVLFWRAERRIPWTYSSQEGANNAKTRNGAFRVSNLRRRFFLQAKGRLWGAKQRLAHQVKWCHLIMLFRCLTSTHRFHSRTVRADLWLNRNECYPKSLDDVVRRSETAKCLRTHELWNDEKWLWSVCSMRFQSAIKG